jgi:uncharacterized membrane protein
MYKVVGYLLSPNAWVGVCSILAFTGLVLCAIGFATGIRLLSIIGFSLMVPILVGGAVIIVLIVPILLLANRRRKRKSRAGGTDEAR